MTGMLDDDNSSADGDLSDDDEDAGGKKKPKKKTKTGQSVCNVSFSNYDLGNLVNGWPDDPIKDHPFDFHFSKDSIIRSHIAVGFMPMTGRAARDPKARFKFGPGGCTPRRCGPNGAVEGRIPGGCGGDEPFGLQR